MKHSWARKPLGEILSIASGQVDPTAPPFAEMPHIGGDNIESQTGRIIGVATARELGLTSGKYEFTTKDVLYSKIRPNLNKVAVPDFDGICSADIYPLRPLTGVTCREFLAYLLRSDDFLDHAEKHSARTNIPKLNRDGLLAYEVLLPPLSEQKRIAAILDQADSLRRKREQSISLINQFLRSAFLDLFGDPVTNSKGWLLERLDNISSVHRGKFTPRPRNDPRFYDGKYPFIQTGDLSNCTGVLRTWKQTLNEEGITVSRQFPKGTVAIAIAANIGDTAILGFDAYMTDSVVGIEIDKSKAVAEYVEFWFRFQQQHLKDRAPETAQKNINLEVLRPLLVPVPPIHLQQKFADIVLHVDTKSRRYECARRCSTSLFDSLVQRAFRGEL